jgi:hypothetical protein
MTLLDKIKGISKESVLSLSLLLGSCGDTNNYYDTNNSNECKADGESCEAPSSNNLPYDINKPLYIWDLGDCETGYNVPMEFNFHFELDPQGRISGPTGDELLRDFNCDDVHDDYKKNCEPYKCALAIDSGLFVQWGNSPSDEKKDLVGRIERVTNEPWVSRENCESVEYSKPWTNCFSTNNF